PGAHQWRLTCCAAWEHYPRTSVLGGFSRLDEFLQPLDLLGEHFVHKRSDGIETMGRIAARAIGDLQAGAFLGRLEREGQDPRQRYLLKRPERAVQAQDLVLLHEHDPRMLDATTRPALAETGARFERQTQVLRITRPGMAGAPPAPRLPERAVHRGRRRRDLGSDREEKSVRLGLGDGGPRGERCPEKANPYGDRSDGGPHRVISWGARRGILFVRTSRFPLRTQGRPGGRPADVRGRSRYRAPARGGNRVVPSWSSIGGERQLTARFAAGEQVGMHVDVGDALTDRLGDPGERSRRNSLWRRPGPDIRGRDGPGDRPRRRAGLGAYRAVAQVAAKEDDDPAVHAHLAEMDVRLGHVTPKARVGEGVGESGIGLIDRAGEFDHR